MDKYRIKKRVMSPDVIEKNIGTEKKAIWKVYIAPLGNRHDTIAQGLCDYLNRPTQDEIESLALKK